MYNVTSVKEAGAIVAALEDIKDAMEGGYPEPTSATDGQVLTADGEGGASWEDASGGVPDYSQASQGSVLATQYGGELGWDRPEDLLPDGSLLPEITGNDDGKVLQAVYNDKSGSYAQWVTPSGGITKYRFAKTDLYYDDKSAIYTIDISGQSIPINNVINVRTDDGVSTFKNLTTYTIFPSSGICDTMQFDSTEYANLEDYVEIIYFA